MPRTRRLLTVVVAAALTAAGLVVPATLPAAAAAPTVLQAGPDFASNTWQDPWDMSNAADLSLDPDFSTARVTSARMSGGAAALTFNAVGFVTLLRTGYPGSLAWGRDARILANQVPAAGYTHLHLHVAASVRVYGRVTWGTSRGSGYIYLTMNRGWNDIDVPLTGPHNGAAWTGRITGLRLDVMARTSTTITLDYARLYRPVSTGVLTWSAPGSTPLVWTEGSGAPNAGGTQQSGPVPGAVSNGRAVQTDLSGFPPGSAFYVGGTQVATIAREPLPVIDSPSASGCGDYAQHTLGHPWTFSSARSLAGMFNMTRVHFTSSHALVATNGAPSRNDPHVMLPIGRGGIDGRAWHRLTIVESYAGGFSLANRPGGGTMARVYWQDTAHRTFALTNDLVTQTGKQTIVLDMAMKASALTETDASAAQRYAFASAARVSTLRWDPNEDPGARTWTLYSVRLAQDCSTRSTFVMSWHDANYVPGSHAKVIVYGTGTHAIATVAERAGTNTLRIPHLPRGSYTVRVTVTTPQGATHQTNAGGPLLVVA